MLMPTRELLDVPVTSPANMRGGEVPISLVGSGLAVLQLRQQIQRIAPYYRRALLVGEPGVGKELSARQMHALSNVHDGPFILCGAARLAEDASVLESARHATLFLSDLGSLTLQHQDGLVRRLSELDRRIRARVAETRLVAASCTDLKTLTATGQFRQDLYSCLSVVELRLPPLRERLEDLEAIAHACFKRSGSSCVLSPEAVKRLREHTWPRNFAEFEQVLGEAILNAAIAGSASIEVEHLPALEQSTGAMTLRVAPPAVARLDDVMHRHVIEVLSRCAGNKLKAAELLGISRSTLYRMLDGG